VRGDSVMVGWVIALGVLAGGAASAAPPEGRYSVSVRSVIREADTVYSEVEVESRAEAVARVGCDEPGRDWCAMALGSRDKPASPPRRARVLIFGDRVTADKADFTKFVLRGEGTGGSSRFCVQALLPPGQDLAAVVSVTAKPGVYRLGEAVEIYRFEGRVYRLMVRPKADDRPFPAVDKVTAP